LGKRKAIVGAALLLASLLARADGLELRAPTDRVALVARDTLWGGVAGAALSGGFLGYRLGLGDGGADWKPVLATGVGLGLVAGLVWGIVEASAPPRYLRPNGPVVDGLAYEDTHADRSGKFVVSFPLGRF
jgi:hypothetical protein